MFAIVARLESGPACPERPVVGGRIGSPRSSMGRRRRARRASGPPFRMPQALSPCPRGPSRRGGVFCRTPGSPPWQLTSSFFIGATDAPIQRGAGRSPAPTGRPEPRRGRPTAMPPPRTRGSGCTPRGPTTRPTGPRARRRSRADRGGRGPRGTLRRSQVSGVSRAAVIAGTREAAIPGPSCA